ncbi:mitochondrial carrier domain-containing protein, putative [Eimeria maxima]|uniref:Mitochondrial carrier domain-containing protein, putative n=1 Tax=Eimeria maxima TaxID=5804 RepID=U6MG79_EIMMA|nr:mitochondrial carrier domain-containing protein, putative [Eimeria maxima]CDJ60650.1 mitochondrial carrier domain-containing protein, putative [Eimeria maxima]
MIFSRDEAVALAAGASTGIIADISLFPLDFLKTHAQGNNVPPVSAAAAPAGPAPPASSQAPVAAAASVATGSPPSSRVTFAAPSSSGGEPTCSYTVVSSHKIGRSPAGVRYRGRLNGLRSCYGGIAALAMGSMPSSAGFFVVYEVVKEKLKHSNTDVPLASTHIAAAAVAESSACVIRDFAAFMSIRSLSKKWENAALMRVRNPFEVVKQQVQLGLHASTAKGFSAVWRLEGPRGFFVGLGTSMLRDVPFAAMQLSLWEWLKLKTLGESPSPTSFTAAVSGAAGMVAGAVAAVATTPMDVVKTRLMTQSPGTRQYRGFFHCLGIMLRQEGLRSLFLGVQMRCLWVALGGGIFLGGYDAFSGYYRRLFERNHLFYESQCCSSCSENCITNRSYNKLTNNGSGCG